MDVGHVDKLVKAQNLIGLGREKQWRKWGYSRKLSILNDSNMTVLTEETGEVARALLENNKMQLLAELIDTAAYCAAWMEAIVDELEYKGLTFAEIQTQTEIFLGLHLIKEGAKKKNDATEKVLDLVDGGIIPDGSGTGRKVRRLYQKLSHEQDVRLKTDV